MEEWLELREVHGSLVNTMQHTLTQKALPYFIILHSTNYQITRMPPSLLLRSQSVALKAKQLSFIELRTYILLINLVFSDAGRIHSGKLLLKFTI